MSEKLVLANLMLFDQVLMNIFLHEAETSCCSSCYVNLKYNLGKSRTWLALESGTSTAHSSGVISTLVSYQRATLEREL